jgi:hypothetical protein
LNCPLGGFKVFEVTIDIKGGLIKDLPLLTGGLGGLGTGTGSLRSRASGLRHFECGSGLLSNTWCVVCKLKGEQQLNKISNPLQKNEEKPQPQQRDNSNPWKQIAVVLKYRKRKKNWFGEGGLKMVQHRRQCGAMWAFEMASGGLWWPAMVVVVIDGGNLGGYVGDLAMEDGAVEFLERQG